MNEKVVTLVNGSTIRDVAIRPGTTTADVLAELGVSHNYWLSAREGIAFGQNEVVYDRINNGEKLFVSAPANVAA